MKKRDYSIFMLVYVVSSVLFFVYVLFSAFLFSYISSSGLAKIHDELENTIAANDANLYSRLVDLEELLTGICYRNTDVNELKYSENEQHSKPAELSEKLPEGLQFYRRLLFVFCRGRDLCTCKQYPDGSTDSRKDTA